MWCFDPCLFCPHSINLFTLYGRSVLLVLMGSIDSKAIQVFGVQCPCDLVLGVQLRWREINGPA